MQHVAECSSKSIGRTDTMATKKAAKKPAKKAAKKAAAKKKK